MCPQPVRGYAVGVSRTALALRVALPAFWIGVIVAISFIEAPLKFLAPDVTLPIGLGIGRLVFTAVNIVSFAILIVLTLVSLRPRPSRATVWILAGIWVVLIIQVFLIRPPLNSRTDAVLAGAMPGESPFHYLYIAADVALLVLLIAYLVVVVRNGPLGRIDIAASTTNESLNRPARNA